MYVLNRTRCGRTVGLRQIEDLRRTRIRMASGEENVAVPECGTEQIRRQNKRCDDQRQKDEKQHSPLGEPSGCLLGDLWRGDRTYLQTDEDRGDREADEDEDCRVAAVKQ